MIVSSDKVKMICGIQKIYTSDVYVLSSLPIYVILKFVAHLNFLAGLSILKLHNQPFCNQPAILKLHNHQVYVACIQLTLN